MNAVEMISLYGNLFYVSMAIAVVGLGLSVFFFFYFDIPTVYALMTGKAKEDTIRRMAEQNAKTGTLKNQYIHTGPTGKTGKNGNSGPMTQNVARSAPQPVADGQTAPLAAPEQNETTILQTATQETTVLGGAVEETMVLGGASADTMVLNAQGPETQVLGYGSEDAGATAVLSASAYAPQYGQMSNSFRFDVTESTLVIHTNEII